MKKIISFLGALLLGTSVIGQVKPDTVKKNNVKKVTPGNVKQAENKDVKKKVSIGNAVHENEWPDKSSNLKKNSGGGQQSQNK